MILSIIIPIFNVEKYIGRCLDSVYQDNWDESLFEVIAVNDGTKDQSMSIVRKYQEKHNNLKIINQTNGGVSSARNHGIQVATADYLIFLDGDDTLFLFDLNVLKSYVLRNHDLQVCIARSFMSNGYEAYKWKYQFSENQDYIGFNVFQQQYFRGSCCGVIYNRKFLIKNFIYFPLNLKNAEDTIFLTHCLSVAYKVRFLDLDLYCVYVRNESASRGVHYDVLLGNYMNTINYINSLLSLNKVKRETKIMFSYCKYIVISNALNLCVINNLSYSFFDSALNLKTQLPIEFPEKNIRGFKIKILNISSRLFFSICFIKYRLTHFFNNK